MADIVLPIRNTQRHSEQTKFHVYNRLKTQAERILANWARMALFFGLLCSATAWGQEACPWFASRSTVNDPPALFSENGRLVADFTYQTEVDSTGLTRFCYKTTDGRESPTLYLNPGDELILHITNLVPPDAPGLPAMAMNMVDGMDISPTPVSGTDICGAAKMTSSSVNLHYHGTNTSPTCHGDEVIHTLVNSGETFTYRIKFPSDEPPGLYYYHPHVHGIAEASVQGGATGLIVIRGIAKLQPQVQGLRQRLLIVRDYPAPPSSEDPVEPANNLSINYVPVPYPTYPPAVIKMKPGETELWRLANTSAETILEVELLYDGVPQTLRVVGLDGVPVGSQDGSRQGKTLSVNHLRIPTAGRAEFLITAPSHDVKKAILITRNVNTGPIGDKDPTRPLAVVDVNSPSKSDDLLTISDGSEPAPRQRFEGLVEAEVTARRTLYFSENNPKMQFFVTVDGAKPTLFNPDNPPAITTHQGSVEEWTIENRALESHEFHIHQIHFLLMAENGVPVSPERQQMLDTVDVPFWSGSGPYPSVTLRLDFRGRDIGDFVYHCHILEHEDHGMMAIIRVLPKE